MAGVGLSKPYYATYSVTAQGVSYSNGGLIGKATELTMTLDGNKSNMLYADNGAAESDNVFGGGTLSLGTDDLLPEATLGILGVEVETISNDAVTTTGAKWLKFNDKQDTPYVGFGGVLKKQINNQTKWVALVYPKIQFKNPGDDAITQGETIEWKTPKLEATLMRDDTTNHEWRRISSPLDSEEEAEGLVKGFLGLK